MDNFDQEQNFPSLPEDNYSSSCLESGSPIILKLFLGFFDKLSSSKEYIRKIIKIMKKQSIELQLCELKLNLNDLLWKS